LVLKSVAKEECNIKCIGLHSKTEEVHLEHSIFHAKVSQSESEPTVEDKHFDSLVEIQVILVVLEEVDDILVREDDLASAVFVVTLVRDHH